MQHSTELRNLERELKRLRKESRSLRVKAVKTVVKGTAGALAIAGIPPLAATIPYVIKDADTIPVPVGALSMGYILGAGMVTIFSGYVSRKLLGMNREMESIELRIGELDSKISDIKYGIRLQRNLTYNIRPRGK